MLLSQTDLSLVTLDSSLTFDNLNKEAIANCRLKMTVGAEHLVACGGKVRCMNPPFPCTDYMCCCFMDSLLYLQQCFCGTPMEELFVQCLPIALTRGCSILPSTHCKIPQFNPHRVKMLNLHSSRAGTHSPPFPPTCQLPLTLFCL